VLVRNSRRRRSFFPLGFLDAFCGQNFYGRHLVFPTSRPASVLARRTHFAGVFSAGPVFGGGFFFFPRRGTRVAAFALFPSRSSGRPGFSSFFLFSQFHPRAFWQTNSRVPSSSYEVRFFFPGFTEVGTSSQAQEVLVPPREGRGKDFLEVSCQIDFLFARVSAIRASCNAGLAQPFRRDLQRQPRSLPHPGAIKRGKPVSSKAFHLYCRSSSWVTPLERGCGDRAGFVNQKNTSPSDREFSNIFHGPVPVCSRRGRLFLSFGRQWIVFGWIRSADVPLFRAHSGSRLFPACGLVHSRTRWSFGQWHPAPPRSCTRVWRPPPLIGPAWFKVFPVFPAYDFPGPEVVVRPVTPIPVCARPALRNSFDDHGLILLLVLRPLPGKNSLRCSAPSL